MKTKATRLFASIISAVIISMSLLLATPVTAAAGGGGVPGGVFSAHTVVSGGIF